MAKGNTFVLLKFKARVLRFKDTCVNIIIMKGNDKIMESVQETSPITFTSNSEP